MSPREIRFSVSTFVVSSGSLISHLLATSNAAATAWAWSSNSGTGTFSTTTALAASYTPSDADTADGSIILTLGSTVNGLCNQVTDFMVLTIDNAIVVDADLSQTTCANNPNAVLNGAVSGGTTNTGVWTSDGGGSFFLCSS